MGPILVSKYKMKTDFIGSNAKHMPDAQSEEFVFNSKVYTILGKQPKYPLTSE